MLCARHDLFTVCFHLTLTSYVDFSMSAKHVVAIVLLKLWCFHSGFLMLELKMQVNGNKL